MPKTRPNPQSHQRMVTKPVMRKTLGTDGQDVLAADQTAVEQARPGRVIINTNAVEVSIQALWPGPEPVEVRRQGGRLEAAGFAVVDVGFEVGEALIRGGFGCSGSCRGGCGRSCSSGCGGRGCCCGSVGGLGVGLNGPEGQNKTTHRPSGDGRKTFDHK